MPRHRLGPVLYRRPTRIPVLAGGMLLVAAAAALATQLAAPLGHASAQLILLSLALGIVGIAVVVGALVLRPMRVRRGVLEVAAGVLTIDGRAVLRRGVTTVVANERHDVLVFDGKRGPALVVHAEGAEDAARLVDSLKSDLPALAEFRFTAFGTTAGRIVTTSILALTTAVMYATTTTLATPAWLVPVCLLGLPLLVISARATVGTDGLMIRWLGFRSFVPFAAVARIDRVGDRLVVTRRDGRALQLLRMVDAEALDALVTRFRLAHANAVGGATVADLLVRGERSESEWKRTLRRLNANDYRTTALSAPRLWEVIGNAGCDESARIGAAMMVRARLSPDELKQLHAVASTVASPRLRVALESIASIADPLEDWVDDERASLGR